MNNKLDYPLYAAVFVGVLFLSACSGKKQEANQEKEADKMIAMKAAAPAKTDTEVMIFEQVDVSVKAQLSGFLVDYFALNKALIEDNQGEARAAARKLSGTVGKFDMTLLKGEQMDFYHKQSAKLMAGLKAIDESSDIEDTRMALVPVSESIFALTKAYRPNATDLYYQFCPMAKNGEGANWLSATKEIINPYMGQRMLKCGKTQEVIAFVK